MTDDHFFWLKEQLEKLQSKQDDMSATLVENTTSLKEHMRRTAILESELTPLKTHVAAFTGVAKALVVTATVLGIAKSLNLL